MSPDKEIGTGTSSIWERAELASTYFSNVFEDHTLSIVGRFVAKFSCDATDLGALLGIGCLK